MSRSGRFIVAAQAEKDMCGIWEYIALDNPQAADRVWQRLTRVNEMLARQPLIGEACEELLPGLRCFPAGNYVVCYCPLKDGVQILRVIHSARDVSSLF